MTITIVISVLVGGLVVGILLLIFSILVRLGQIERKLEDSDVQYGILVGILVHKEEAVDDDLLPPAG